MDLERLHTLMEQISEEIFNLCPSATNVLITICPDGFRNIMAVQYEYGVPVESAKRRFLFNQYKHDGCEWGGNEIDGLNKSASESGMLLGGVKP